MDDDTCFEDFNMRPIIGEEYPFFANLGIAQIEKLISNSQTEKIAELLEKLQADGLIIHVNPIQEFFQPEGDLISRPPVETIEELLELVEYRIIVKEVGQGMGPRSLKALLNLPIHAIELAAYGGTNFSLVELLRAPSLSREFYRPLAYVGHDAEQMLEMINQYIETGLEKKYPQLIISGGIRSFLDGYYLIKKSKLPAVYGQASGFLRYARENYESLREYISHQVKGLQMAGAYLTVKENK